MSIRNIFDRMMQFNSQRNCRRAFLTGGEITIQEKLLFLVNTLVLHKWYVMLQTNGTRFLPDIFDKVNWLSVDIKGPSSGKVSDLSVIESIYDRYREISQFKFIVAGEEDFSYAKWIIPCLPNAKFILQSEWGSDCSNWLVNKILQDKVLGYFDVSFSAQIHKIIWGPNTRGV
jgi:organic radical activating enzyme